MLDLSQTMVCIQPFCGMICYCGVNIVKKPWKLMTQEECHHGLAYCLILHTLDASFVIVGG